MNTKDTAQQLRAADISSIEQEAVEAARIATGVDALDGLALFCDASAWLWENNGRVGEGRGSRPYRWRLEWERPGRVEQPSDRAGRELLRHRLRRARQAFERRMVMFEALGWRVMPDPGAAAALAATGPRLHVSSATDRAVSHEVAASQQRKRSDRPAFWLARVEGERDVFGPLDAGRARGVARPMVDGRAAAALAVAASRVHVSSATDRAAHSDALVSWARRLGVSSLVERVRVEGDSGWTSARGFAPDMSRPSAADLAAARDERAAMRRRAVLRDSVWGVRLVMDDESVRVVPAVDRRRAHDAVARWRLAAGVMQARVVRRRV